jgi:ribonuclease P protein component
MDPTPRPSLGLPKARRIKQGRDFSRLRVEGKRVVQGCLILNWVPLPHAGPCRLGVITSKKIGEAVARARARRLLREAFRLHQHHLTASVDVVLVARQSIARRDFAFVERDYLSALKKARLLKETVPASSTIVEPPKPHSP